MTVHLALYDTFADYEYGHVAAHLPGGVTTVGPTREPVTSKAGLRITPDLALAELRPEDSAMLILPGADLWFGDALAPFARTARAFLAAGVPVAAICGATYGLAAEGLLDDRDHTSAAPEYLAMSGYGGAARYRDADAVTDGDLITAGPTAPIAFAREVFARLGTFPPEVLDAWYRLFRDADPEAYAVFAAAQEAPHGGEEPAAQPPEAAERAARA
ncbi:DJ-1/PfpI family protein [Streptomyces sp. JJ36]|uniref:DJ-1/PfpI family protein n=1 Tax=Streptomyces sp. JJ36 TaxID=2736645 RepID=UPI001F1E81E4|nr:DJ-1/PfpI family protein [Streptomyces sp. JJ36]MCF6523581.1 DJ-1/PfpI family protein [Streptomyces sp. JJ36]